MIGLLAGSTRCAAFASQETAQSDVADAEQQLETCWRLLPQDSSLKFTAGPSQLARDFATIAAEVEAAVDRRQQQVDMLRDKLKDSQGELLLQQQRVQQLQEQVVGFRTAGEIAQQQEVAAVQAKGGKKLLKAEQKLLKLVSLQLHLHCSCFPFRDGQVVAWPLIVQASLSFCRLGAATYSFARFTPVSTSMLQAQVHQSAVAEFQQQIQQYQDQLSTAQQQQERLHDEQQALQQRAEQLENQMDELQEKLVTERAAKTAAEEQVSFTCFTKAFAIAACYRHAYPLIRKPIAAAESESRALGAPMG